MRETRRQLHLTPVRTQRLAEPNIARTQPLKSSGREANLDRPTNLVTWEVLFYTSSKESNIRPNVAAGAGIKVYSGLEPRVPSLDQRRMTV
jgi:hypothetical protein